MNQGEYFQSNPPRCLADFVVTPANLPDIKFAGNVGTAQPGGAPEGSAFDDPDRLDTTFAVACRCGGRRHFIHCYKWANPHFGNIVVMLSPIDLECASCGVLTRLIDIDLDGYDPEIGAGSATARALGEHIAYECETCGKQAFEVFALFDYPDDLFDGDFAEFAGREQDLFSWFSLIALCGGCAKYLAVTDFECS